MAIRVFEDRRPRYQSVAEQLSAAIERGTYPVGGMLPTEAELCTKFGVSRQTIREATRLLLEAGLVSRHQGVGTRVERATVPEHYVQRLERLPDILQYVKDTRRRLIKLGEVVTPDARIPLPGGPGDRWRTLEGLRFVGNESRPLAWTIIHVRKSYGAVMDAKDRDELPIYSLIERRYGIKTGTLKQEISAVAIAPDIAAHLRVPAGSPGLSIIRHYVSTEDEVFEVSVSIHPADRYHYTMRLDLAFAPRGEQGGEVK